MKMPELKPEYPCGNCAFGTLRLGRGTLVHYYGKHLLTVPNTKIWHCDVCDWVKYEQAAVQRLEALLGSAGESQAQRIRRLRKNRVESCPDNRNARSGHA